MGAHKAIVITSEGDGLTPEEAKSFWDQGVCLDDWDVMVLLEDPDAVLEREEVEVEDWVDGELRKERKKETRYSPKDWYLDKMLNGCCDNKWHRASFRGKEYAVGVAYHA
jgi:hypothetical protein